MTVASTHFVESEARVLSTRLSLELKDQLVQHFAQEQTYGCGPDPSAEQMLTFLFNVAARRISRQPRRVVLSDELEARSLTPKVQLVLAALTGRSEAGEDLNVFLHRRLRVEPGYEDRSLAEHGLHHLHLGSEVPKRKTGLIHRSRDLLLAVVLPDTLNLVAIRAHDRKHRDAWLDPELPRSAERNWPGALAESKRLRERRPDWLVGPHQLVGPNRPPGTPITPVVIPASSARSTTPAELAIETLELLHNIACTAASAAELAPHLSTLRLVAELEDFRLTGLTLALGDSRWTVVSGEPMALR